MVKSIAFTDLMRGFCRTSPGVAAAIAVNVAVFVVVRLMLLFNPSLIAVVELPGSLEAIAAKPWTLLTFAFVQVDFLHLLVNMLILYFFGRRLGSLSRQRLFWLIYIAGALAGALTFAATARDASDSLVGSSASVMAVTVAAAVANPRHRVVIFPGVQVRMWVPAAVIVGIDVLTITAPDSTAHVVHIAGCLVGAAVGAVVLLLRRPVRPLAVQPRNNKGDDVGVILRKLRDSGHDSLTAEEKCRLFNLTDRSNR